MGMSSSQARLLTLTSRLHDIEFKAQNIMNQKIALATQKDDAFDRYNEACSAKKYQIAFSDGISKIFVDATYDTMVNYCKERTMQYSLKDTNTGKIVLNSATANLYDKYSSDKYSFAFAMMGMDGQFGYEDGDMATGLGIDVNSDFNTKDGYVEGASLGNLFMTEPERVVFDNFKDTDGKLKKMYEDLDDKCKDPQATKTEKEQMLSDFRDYLYSKYSKEIYDNMRLSKTSEHSQIKDATQEGAIFDERFDQVFPKNEFNHYVRLFEQVQSCGGYVLIDDHETYGDDGADWFNKMLTSGSITLEMYNNKGWEATSASNTTNANYLTDTLDNNELKKAEIEYDKEMSIINSKDSKFDRDLKNLETESSAVKKEMESIKKVKDENIDRTFGIFS